MEKQKAIFLIRIFALVITFSITLALFPKQISAQQNDVNYQEFYNQLSPYGEWIENYEYGYVWIPDAGPDFTPYLTNGYWVMTNYGWTWVSDYEWGWATFHYGRWDYNGSYGWFWVPDNEWGPSWVTWRRSNGYYGWAPMRPGVSISITFGSYNDVPNDRWIFVRDRDLESHDIGRNHIDRKNNYNIIKNSKVIERTFYDDKRKSTYVSGPRREDFQKIIGRTINPVAVHERDRPGQSFNNDQLQIYRPRVQKNNNGKKPGPSHLTDLKDIKRISERDAGKQTQNVQQPNNKPGKSERQPAVNPTNRIETKNHVYQTPNLTEPRKENRINQPTPPQNMNKPRNNNGVNQQQKTRSINPLKNENRIDRPKQPQNINVPRNNGGTDQPKARTISPPRNETRVNRPSQPQNINAPRNNNGAVQQPKARTMNPPQEKSVDQPSKANSNDDKKEKRER